MISVTTSLFQHFGEAMRVHSRETFFLKVLIAYIINKSPKMTKKFFNLGQVKSIEQEKLVLSQQILGSLTNRASIRLLFRFQMNIKVSAIDFLKLRKKPFLPVELRPRALDDSSGRARAPLRARFLDDFGLERRAGPKDSSAMFWENVLVLFSKLLGQIEKMKLIKIGKEEVRVIYLVISTPDLPFQMKLRAEKILLANKSFTKDFALSSLSLYRNKKFSRVFLGSRLAQFLKILIRSLQNKESALKCLKILFLFLEDALEDSSLCSIIGETNIAFSSQENLAEDKNLVLASLDPLSSPSPDKPVLVLKPSLEKSFLDPPQKEGRTYARPVDPRKAVRADD